MKQSILLTLCAMACSAALAQAPAGVVKNPSAETDPNAAGGKTAEKAQMNVDARKAKDGSMPMAGADTNMRMNGMNGMKGMDMKAMDTNGDGMVSKKEWQDHHNMMWTRMKPKNGSLSVSEMQGKERGGPN